ncbi:complement factor H-like [Periophthalmus magnuspinnatus]|uniref:complement factor H-like n=1 Tax=Periophthalmus magnuspinnatus TaxID=409849 RepID=UPI00243742E4|nr:complement factor H-like [Periophthalmus magnuspinnatus]
MKPTVILMLFLWSFVEFTSTLKECSKLPSFQHAFVLDEYKKAEYQEGDVIYFCCDPGFTTGLNTTYICTEHGWRAATIGQCIEDSFPVLLGCTPPPPVTNGYVLQNTTLMYGNGQIARYQCNSRYKLRGGSFKICNNGQWTGDVQCIGASHRALTCKVDSYPPVGTTYRPQGKNIFIPGQTLSVSCGDNKWVKRPELQSAQLMCQDTGNWDFPPVCKRQP